MSKVKLVFLVTFATFFLFAFNSCTESILGNDEPKNIIDILKDDEDHSIFSEMHERLNYISTGGTVFAPTDGAFQQYFNLNGLSLETMTDDQIETLFNYHYLRLPKTKEELIIGFNDTQEMYSYDSNPVAMLIERNSSGVYLNRYATTTITDIEAEEGVIHVINKVLTPPTSMDLARFENLDSFIVAMDRVDAATGIYTTIEALGSGAYSIVAPKNQAFVEGLANNNWNSIADVPISVLEHAMKEQIFDKNLVFEDKSYSSMYSLNGNSAIYDGDDYSIADFPAYNAKIIQFEIQGSNGTLMITNEVFLF